MKGNEGRRKSPVEEIEGMDPNKLRKKMPMNDKNKKAVGIYDLIAEEYSRNFDSIDSPGDLVFLNAFLRYLKPDSHIVDIGCGTGFSAGYFAKKGMLDQKFVEWYKEMFALAHYVSHGEIVNLTSKDIGILREHADKFVGEMASIVKKFI